MSRDIAPNGRGAGRFRDKWAIRKHLDQMGTNGTREAKAIGIYAKQFNETIAGLQNNRKALQHLVELGVPREVLSLPADMLE